MSGFSRWAIALGALTLVSACDNGSSAVETRERSGEAQAATPKPCINKKRRQCSS